VPYVVSFYTQNSLIIFWWAKATRLQEQLRRSRPALIKVETRTLSAHTVIMSPCRRTNNIPALPRSTSSFLLRSDRRVSPAGAVASTLSAQQKVRNGRGSRCMGSRVYRGNLKICLMNSKWYNRPHVRKTYTTKVSTPQEVTWNARGDNFFPPLRYCDISIPFICCVMGYLCYPMIINVTIKLIPPHL
jgi:hypothetical protein